MDRHILFGFTDVDQTADPDYFIRFLDTASSEESFQGYKRRSFSLLEIKSGQRILELGGGTGDDARALAVLVGPQGRVDCVDNSQAMVDEARKRVAGSGLPVFFQVGDAHHLSFADNAFAASRSDRMFMHVEDPSQSLREMIRVTRPGGLVLVYEVDFETLVIDAPDRVLARKIMNTGTDGFRNGWLGRHIPALFREAGLLDVRAHPETLRLTYPLICQVAGQATVERARAAQLISAADGETWLRFLEMANEKGWLFSTITGFLVVGRKPRTS
jgi:ubiquinone/menaquinone biosynthesis C-methylase UbiE